MNWLQKTCQSEELFVYHGSSAGDLSQIDRRSPSYEGGIGAGIYVDFDEETASYYGEHVYKFQLRFGWESILNLGPDHHYLVEGSEGCSVLVGENIHPFSFYVGEQLYTVGDDIVVNRLAIELFGLELNDYDELKGLPIVLPDDYSGLEELELDELQLSPQQLVLIQELAAQSQTGAEEQVGQMIDLDDIGGIAEDAGYKAVYLSGVRSGGSVDSELLVFDPSDLIFLGLTH